MSPTSDPRADHGPPRLFISYARSDGRDFAERLEERLAAEGLESWRDMRHIEGGEDILPQVLRAIEEAEHLVLILTRSALASDWVKKEWTHARMVGRKVSPILADPSLRKSDLPPWARRVDVYDIGERERWAKLVSVLKAEGRTRRVPYMEGILPESFVPRTREWDRVKSAILSAESGAVGLTTALTGAGGYGKTTLANAICRDEDVRFEFSDGVVRVEIGKERDSVLALVADLIETLDPAGKRPGFQDEGVAAERLKEVIGDARLLLVLDDVWREAQLRPFMLGGPNCVRLVTTRQPRVLPAGAVPIEIDELADEEALALLSWELPNQDPAARAALKRIASRLENWAQMLEIANGWLRSRLRLGESLVTAAEGFEARLAKRGLVAFDPRDSASRNRAIGLCVDASLEDLTEEERSRFEELAIVPEDEDVPVGYVGALWARTGDLDEFATDELLVSLRSLSLLQRLDLGEGIVRLHDNMKWLLRDRLGAERLTAAHGAMADAVRARAGGDWAALPREDRYGWRNGLEHLRAEGRIEEANGLLTSFRWIEAKLRVDGAQALVEAYRSESTNDDAELVGRALAMSTPALSRWPDQLALQIIGRLLGLPGLRMQRLCAEARTSPSCWPAPRRPFLSRPGAELLRIDNSSFDAIFSPDDTLIAAGCRDYTLRLYDATTGVETASFPYHDWGKGKFFFSPDGSKIVDVSRKDLRICSIATGSVLQLLRGSGDHILYLAGSANGALIGAVSSDGSARIWSAKSGAEIAIFRRHASRIVTISFSTDGTLVALGCEDGTVILADVSSSKHIAELRGHSARINEVSFAPNGAHLATCANDGRACIWDIVARSELMRVRVRDGGIRSVGFSPDERLLATASNGDRTRLWSISDGKETAVMPGRMFRFSPDGARLATASPGFKLWEVATGAELFDISSDLPGIQGIAFNSDWSRTVTTSTDRKARVWSLANRPAGENSYRHEGEILGVGFSRREAFAISYVENGTAKIWDVSTGFLEATLLGVGDNISSLAFTNDDNYVAISYYGKARIWDVHSGKMLKHFGRDPRRECVATSLSTGALIAILKDNGEIDLWDVLSQKQIKTLTGSDIKAKDVAFTRSGRQIIVTRDNDSAYMWCDSGAIPRGKRLNTGGNPYKIVLSPDEKKVVFSHPPEGFQLYDLNEDVELRYSTSKAKFLAFSPDGRLLAMTYDDGNEDIYIIDIELDEEIMVLNGHKGLPFMAEFSPDGMILASLSHDKTVRLWSLQSSEEIAVLCADDRLSVHEAYCITRFAFSPDSNMIVTASDDQSIRIWSTSDGRLLFIIEMDAGATAVAVTSDTLVVGDSVGNVGIFDLGTPPPQDPPHA